MEKWNPAKEPHSGEKSESKGGKPHVTQMEAVQELLTEAAPQKIKQEPDDGPEQCLDTQWPEFLKMCKSLQSEWQHFRLPSPVLEVNSKSVQESSLNGTAEVGQWPRGEGLARDLPDLLGEAQQACRDVDSFHTVKVEVVDEDDAVSLEVRRQQFRQLSYREAESPREICRQLQELCRRWLVPEKYTKEQILDLLILEQFLTILPQEMQSWVRERGPETCAEAVGLAEEFLSMLQGPEKQEGKDSGPLEETIMNICKVEEVKSDSVKRQLSLEVSLLGVNDPVLEKKEEPFQLERPALEQVGISKEERTKGKLLPGFELEENPKTLLGSQMPPKRYLWKRMEQSLFCEGRGHGFHENTFPGRNDKSQRTAAKSSVGTGFGKSLFQSLDPFKHQKKPMQKYKCSYCGTTSSIRANIIIHERIHTGEKPYTCLTCGRSFNRKSALVRHKRTHTGEKPYNCSACGRSFNVRYNLIRHERVHTGEKPYLCMYCGQSFAERGMLVVHERTHTGEKK